MDDANRTEEPLSRKDVYEPPRLTDLGDVEGLTSVTDNASVGDGG
jgi:hypothetical protein